MHKKLKRFRNFVKWPLALILAALLVSPKFWQFWTNADIHFNASIVLSYIDVLRWPIVVLIALTVLKPLLPGLVKRLIKLNAGKASAEFAPPQDVESEEVKAITNESSKKSAVGESDKEIEKQLTTPEAETAYEQIYEVIFGTQLSVVKRLKDHLIVGLLKDDLSDLYDAHIRSSDPAYPSFEAFMQFLIDNILVLYDVTDKRYKLTYAGLYFLIYISNKGQYQAYKPN